MSKKILCPLMSHRPFDQEHLCIKEDCAWWIEDIKAFGEKPFESVVDCGGCAIKILAQNEKEKV